MENRKAPTDPLDLRAQEREKKRRAQEDERRRAEYLLALSDVMDTPSGRLVLRTLMKRSRLYQLSYSPQGAPADVAFLEGIRNTGLRLFSDMSEANGTRCLEVLQEAQKEQK